MIDDAGRRAAGQGAPARAVQRQDLRGPGDQRGPQGQPARRPRRASSSSTRSRRTRFAPCSIGYPKLREVCWVQEEPENMGAWEFVRPLLEQLIDGRWPLRYIGRVRNSSPSEGSSAWHAANQRAIVEQAFEREARDIEGNGPGAVEAGLRQCDRSNAADATMHRLIRWNASESPEMQQHRCSRAGRIRRRSARREVAEEGGRPRRGGRAARRARDREDRSRSERRPRRRAAVDQASGRRRREGRRSARRARRTRRHGDGAPAAAAQPRAPAAPGSRRTRRTCRSRTCAHLRTRSHPPHRSEESAPRPPRATSRASTA